MLFGNQAILDGQLACGTPPFRVTVRILNGAPFGPRALDSLSSPVPNGAASSCSLVSRVIGLGSSGEGTGYDTPEHCLGAVSLPIRYLEIR